MAGKDFFQLKQQVMKYSVILPPMYMYIYKHIILFAIHLQSYDEAWHWPKRVLHNGLFFLYIKAK